jgi:hypothetical protein
MRQDLLTLAYKLGADAAASIFQKHADGPAGGLGGYGTEAEQPADPNALLQQLPPGVSLGDPNFWSGGSQAEGAAPQDPEQALQLLPAGTFLGMNIKITPDGQKTTRVQVSPDALIDPQALQAMFQADPNAKVEMQAPDNGPDVALQGQQQTTGGSPGTPGTGGGSLAGQAPGQE